MAIVTGDRYLESLVKFVENNAELLIEGTLVLKLNPVGLRYVQSRLEALAELEALLTGAPVDYLRAYVSDLGDHRALEQLRRILRFLPSLKVVSVLPPPARDPTPLSLLPFSRLKVLELRGCDLSTSAARGLLELRHTLEKLICHNSTDALRHVFASRIAEIKKSPQWNRLSFVSCAFNSLVLMDESLHLLPAVETLDLSSNKFARVDNLRKCSKLRHLDLGFNNLRTISSFGEVSCQIVKLVLRNNALTTLRGIQNLKSLEGLDVSYNIISNFLEIEILAGLPSLRSLWLEGNPLYFARWYRAQVFSYFPVLDNLRLDGKTISTGEFWKRQIIIASRQKRPASFGFYSPAEDGGELEGSIYTKRKRISRLASIESGDQSTFFCSDRDSASFDNEIQSKQDNGVSDEEAEIVDLMNRIELMKKERSDLWLQEFKEWMDPATLNVDARRSTGEISSAYNSKNMRNDERDHPGETSRVISESIQVSGDDSSTNNLESDNSFADTSVGLSAQSYLVEEGPRFFLQHLSGDSLPVIKSLCSSQVHLKSSNREWCMYTSGRSMQVDSFTRDSKLMEELIIRPITAIDDIVDSHSFSVVPGSPPHYQEDILHRRQNLEEEFLQLSAESISVASSDSNTSYSEDDSTEFASWIPQMDQSLIVKFSERSTDDYSSLSYLDLAHYGTGNKQSPPVQNGGHASNVHDKENSAYDEIGEQGSSSQVHENPTAGVMDVDMLHFVKHKAVWLEKKKHSRKPKRRIITLSDESKEDIKLEDSCKSNGNLYCCADNTRDKGCCNTSFSKSVGGTRTLNDVKDAHIAADSVEIISLRGLLCKEPDDQAMSFFLSKLQKSGVQDSWRQFLQCECLLEKNSGWTESKVCMLLSGENKVYVVLINGENDGSG